MIDQHDAAEGDLATVTDEEWRAAHDRLFRDLVDTIGGTEEMDRAAAQFDYQWSPGQPYREPVVDPAAGSGPWPLAEPDPDTGYHGG